MYTRKDELHTGNTADRGYYGRYGVNFVPQLPVSHIHHIAVTLTCNTWYIRQTLSPR